MSDPDDTPDINDLFRVLRQHFGALYGLDHPPEVVSVRLKNLPVAVRYVIPHARDLVTHTADFAVVTIGGKPFPPFSRRQRAAVAYLWAQHVAGRKAVPQAEILRACGSEGTRLDHVFLIDGNGKKKKHPAWGTLIVSNRRGSFWLDLP